MAEQGKSSKAGRKKKSAQNLKYVNEQRHDKSHVRRLKRHLVLFPGDAKALGSLEFYKSRLGIRRAA